MAFYSTQSFQFKLATSENWEDLEMENLFGKNGACGGCWCMWWRLKRSEFGKEKGEGNKNALRKIVESGEVPGIIAYSDNQPVAWCSAAPREAFPALERSRILKRIDDEPVWSIVCFYVNKKYRRKGLTVELIKASVEYARTEGAKIVEGYPVLPKKDSVVDVFAFTGLFSAFKKAGFVEAARPSETRPIMRYYL